MQVLLDVIGMHLAKKICSLLVDYHTSRPFRHSVRICTLCSPLDPEAKHLPIIPALQPFAARLSIMGCDIRGSQVDRALSDSLALLQAGGRVLVLLFAFHICLVDLGAAVGYVLANGHQDCRCGGDLRHCANP